MSVLYLTPGCFDKGGISRYNRYQISALREILGSRSIHVCSVLGPGADSFEDAFEVDAFAGGNGNRQKARFIRQNLKLALKYRPSVIVAAHVNLSALARVLARVFHARYLVNIYGKEVWSNLRRDARWGLAGADGVISDCHFTASYAEAHGLRQRGSIQVVWDCVDLEKFRPGPATPEVLARYGIPEPNSAVNVLTLGRMSTDAAHKGYDRLLEAFRRIADKVPNMHLVFAGRGNLVMELRRQATLAGLGDRVRFTGMVHERDLPDVYRSAHLFSLVSDRGPGRGEGIPLTPLEAAACGLPILVGNQDGSQEAVVEDKNGSVLDPFDLDAHASALARLGLDEQLRRTKGAAALEIARRVFSYEAFREKHRALARSWGDDPRWHSLNASVGPGALDVSS